MLQTTSTWHDKNQAIGNQNTLNPKSIYHPQAQEWLIFICNSGFCPD